MTTCNWCGVSGDLNIVEYEGYGRLCHGCWFCVKHGAPQRMDADKPFTEEQKSLLRFTKNLTDCVKHCFHSVGTIPNSHGEFAPDDVSDVTAMRCCHCGRYESSVSPEALEPSRITFRKGVQ